MMYADRDSQLIRQLRDIFDSNLSRQLQDAQAKDLIGAVRIRAVAEYKRDALQSEPKLVMPPIPALYKEGAD